MSQMPIRRHRVEIAGGLGPTVGKVWRVGLMGSNATPETARRVAAVLREAITATSGFKLAKL